MGSQHLPHLDLVGMVCGASRWPNFSNHPDCWGAPWKGRVLAINDPRAWERTVAFGPRLPTQDEVDEHIRRVRAVFPSPSVPGDGDPFAGTVPVLWEFGEVRWDKVTSIRPYAEDLADWEQQRNRRFASSQQHLTLVWAA